MCQQNRQEKVLNVVLIAIFNIEKKNEIFQWHWNGKHTICLVFSWYYDYVINSDSRRRAVDIFTSTGSLAEGGGKASPFLNVSVEHLWPEAKWFI